jgi:hypothetical protein
MDAELVCQTAAYALKRYAKLKKSSFATVWHKIYFPNPDLTYMRNLERRKLCL